MKVLHLADIHGRAKFSPPLVEWAKRAELMVITGDITHFGGYQDAEGIISTLKTLNDNILAVTGNCDHPGVLDLLRDEGIDLEGKGKVMDEVGFFGTGGSGPTPFDTPNEKSEEAIGKEMEKGYEVVAGADKIVLVSHTPPRDSLCDITGSGVHAGSSAVRDFIKAHRVDYCLCGHIHEARATERMGSTWLVNPGPAPGGFAFIDTGTGEVRLQ